MFVSGNIEIMIGVAIITRPRLGNALGLSIGDILGPYLKEKMEGGIVSE